MSTTGGPQQAPSKRDDRQTGLLIVGAMSALMWLVEIIDQATGDDLDRFGIRPRAVDGLDGILFSPFLHGSFGHLIGNTFPFLIMGGVIALSGAARVVLVTVIVGLVAGVGTWLTAPDNSITVGASGIVLGYATYLLARGIFSRRLLQIVVGVVVGVVWGGSLLLSLVPRDGVSWQAHLFGAIGGVLAAYLLDTRPSRTGATSAR
ncbi:rhomboid family intramembrane serine protease [Patulibacter brassicae]|jgi:membrane associated rhomboid family serine protease|uniref:Rhomboid family intramembrane serine protease n=1 Tax=Patulibacter brassicae TaxID=1705717 RepID=A0ABU4VNK0_9ACTN|nr:rhomboid family intramembrane serine protease [Patulibacter brassicae]MDX8153432.1 rhomboid family intramembrane serine protease [Patulibacter brassicae]